MLKHINVGLLLFVVLMPSFQCKLFYLRGFSKGDEMFNYTYLLYFDELSKYVPTESLAAFSLIKNAGYEIPKYLTDRIPFPKYIKDKCQGKGKIDPSELAIDLYNADTQNDFTIIRQLDKSGKTSKTGAYVWVFSFYYSICMCKKGVDVALSCPNPCRRYEKCGKEAHSFRQCSKVKKLDGLASLIQDDARYFEDIYGFAPACHCEPGYTWDTRTETCSSNKLGGQPCPLLKFDLNVCQDHGSCQVLGSGKYHCECLPAWKGILCETLRNPCAEVKGICSGFRCTRDHRNTFSGVKCDCPEGLVMSTDSVPQCVDEDECTTREKSLCLHGTCINLQPILNMDNTLKYPGYKCICDEKYEGDHCDRKHFKGLDGDWSEWSEWTLCSSHCGIGLRQRTRDCLSEQSDCVGTDMQEQICMAKEVTCDEGSITEHGEVVFQSGEHILREWSMYFDEEFGELADVISWNEDENAQEVYHFDWRRISMKTYLRPYLIQLSKILIFVDEYDYSKPVTILKLLIFSLILVGVTILICILYKIHRHIIRFKRIRRRR